MKIGCVLMAAGLGRRFGENKLTVDLGCGETLINYALSAIPGDKLHRVVVVTQYPQVAALAEKYSFTPLHNPYPERGQSESIRIGLAALSDCDAVMFQVADQPPLQKETVAALRAHEGELLLMEVSPSQLIDIDSPEQLEKL